MTNILYKSGDLMTCDEKFIVHGCNAQGKMGSGVAKAVREFYPDAYAAYLEYYLKKGLSVGELVIAKNITCKKDGKIRTVINAITQCRYGYDGSQFVDYQAIGECIEGVANYIHFDLDLPRATKVGLPMIGAGLGGGDWEKIQEIINFHSLDYFQPVVYQLKN